MNTNFKVNGLTQLEIKPGSAAPGAEVLSSWQLNRVSEF